MPIDEKDFEVIEETINDFSYFYDEEEEFKRNRKIIKKYKLLSVLIFVFLSFIFILLLGIVRMKLYDTKNVLTKEEIKRIEYLKTTKEIIDEIVVFNNNLELINDDDEIHINEQAEYIINDFNASSTLSNFEYYIEELESIKIPKKYTDYNEAIYNVLEIGKNTISQTIIEKDNVTNISSFKVDFKLAYDELAYQHNNIDK